jgi:hypothetical protein
VPTTPAPRPIGLATLPCFFCDHEYLTRTFDLDHLSTERLGAAQSARYDGCQCDHCSAPMGETPVDLLGTDTAQAMTVFGVAHGVGTDRRISTIITCPSHAREINGVFTQARCAACGCQVDDQDWAALLTRTFGDTTARRSSRSGVRDRIDRASEVMAALEAFTVNGEPRPVQRLATISNAGTRAGAAMERMMIDNLNANRAGVIIDPVNNDRWCASCHDTALTCDDCGCFVAEGSHYDCDAHDALTCYRCSETVHGACYQRTDVDAARNSFTPRSNVNTMLRTPGVPGVTIRSTRAVGVEVETRSGRIADVLDGEADALVPIIAAVGTDSSVNGPHSVEFRLLPQRGAAVEYALRSIHDRCSRAAYDPDTSCGVHMHLDASDLGGVALWRAFAALLAAEDVFYALATPQRQRSRYCIPFGEDRVERMRRAVENAAGNTAFDAYGAGGDSRYRGINTHSYATHRTLELRMFDTAHDHNAVTRYTLAAMLGTALVDYANTPGSGEVLAAMLERSVTDWPVTLMAALTEAGLIDPSQAMLLLGQVHGLAPAMTGGARA